MLINPKNVFKSYNGKSGCMCGCLGSYRLPSHTPIIVANYNLGYQGFDAEDVSDRAVKMAAKKVSNALEFIGPHPQNIEVWKDDLCAGINDRNGRTTVVYFVDGIHQEVAAKYDRELKKKQLQA